MDNGENVSAALVTYTDDEKQCLLCSKSSKATIYTACHNVRKHSHKQLILSV